MRILLAFILTSGICLSKVIEDRDTRLRIYVLDTELPPPELNKDHVCLEARTKEGLKPQGPYLDHGTNVVGIIASRIDPKTHCIHPVSVFTRGSRGVLTFDVRGHISALKEALDHPRTVAVNLSMSGKTAIFEELELLAKLVRKGSIVSVSAGNESSVLRRDSCNFYPACYWFFIPEHRDRFVVVTAHDVDVANKVTFPHKVYPGKDRGVGIKLSGTSQAAAEFVAEEFDGSKKDR